MAQAAVRRALGEGDLRHEARLDPAGIPADLAVGIDERARLALEAGQALAELLQVRRVEAGSDAAAVVEILADIFAQQQGGEGAAFLVGKPVSADDELIVAGAFALQPGFRALREIGLVGALRHDAFETEPARFGKHFLAVPDDVIAVDNALRR